MKAIRTVAGFSLDLFGFHPSGCRPSSGTLKRGHRTTALPPEPEFLNSRRKLSVLLLLAAITVTVLTLCPASAHAQGGVSLWTNRYDGPANNTDEAQAIAVDSNGNVLITGRSWSGNDFEAGYGYATIKYSSLGVPLWTNRYDEAGGFSSPTGLAVDGTGNVFVTGNG